jgi:hypothetical protein
MSLIGDMKRTIFFPLYVLAFFLFTLSESAGAELACSVVDWHGHEISSAMSSDIVFLVAAVPVKRPKNIMFKTTIQYHSSNPRLYSISQSFNGHFNHEGGVGTEYHRTVVWIPDSSYIDAVTVKSIFPGIGKCTKTIEIIQ